MTLRVTDALTPIAFDYGALDAAARDAALSTPDEGPRPNRKPRGERRDRHRRRNQAT